MKTRYVNSLFLFIFIILLFPCHASGIELKLDSDKLFDFAFKAYKSGEFEEASSSFYSFTQFFPGDKRVEQAMILRGYSLFLSGKYKDASSVFRIVFEKNSSGREAVMTSGLMISTCFLATGDRASAIAFMENWYASLALDDPARDRVRYETGWLYLANDDRSSAEKRFTEIKASGALKTDEIVSELAQVSGFEKNPLLAGCLSVVPGGGFAYLGRYSDAFAALMVDSALGIAAWQSFDKELPALGGIISFVGAGFYLGGIYGSVSAAQKMNRKNRASFYDSLKTRLYVGHDGLGAVLSVDY